jgi:hypothetical protein
MAAMLAYMDNNNQRLFKDAATVFEALENNKTQLELTSDSKTIAVRSTPGSKTQQKHVLARFWGWLNEVPSSKEQVLTSSGMVLASGLVLSIYALTQ